MTSRRTVSGSLRRAGRKPGASVASRVSFLVFGVFSVAATVIAVVGRAPSEFFGLARQASLAGERLRVGARLRIEGI